MLFGRREENVVIRVREGEEVTTLELYISYKRETVQEMTWQY